MQAAETYRPTLVQKPEQILFMEDSEMEDSEIKLSPSEKQTLRLVAEGDRLANKMDWVALQRLKELAFIEERGTDLAITKEGRRALKDPATRS